MQAPGAASCSGCSVGTVCEKNGRDQQATRVRAPAVGQRHPELVVFPRDRAHFAGHHPPAISADLCPAPLNEGYEWLYVLNGRLRLVPGDHDLVLVPGEAAEFDTRVPHWFGAADAEAVEFLSLFGRQGERAYLRARPAARQQPASGGI